MSFVLQRIYKVGASFSDTHLASDALQRYLTAFFFFLKL
jgi:hypothetical protein